MTLKERLSEDLNLALKSGDKVRVSAIRMLKSRIKNAEIAKLGEFNDAEVVEVIQSSVKQIRESIGEFQKGNRPDLVAKEEAELHILQPYLPPQLSEAEVRRLVAESITESGATTARDMGKVMAVLMPKVKGQADGRMVSQLVKEKLAG